MIAPPKTYELTVFTMIVYNSITAFAFSQYKATLSPIALSQKRWEVYFISLKVVTRIEALLTNITEIAPNLIPRPRGWICPGVKMGISPFLKIGANN